MESINKENSVGILAMQVYFPSSYVTQEDLETANGASKGKYTIGLGQETMAFTGDLEDINSIALSVVQSLLEEYKIDPKEIGRLEIGTESLVDKSKSTKTVLMELFKDSGNTDVEGATVVNACYGGTAALLNAFSWVDSSAWDGRYAIVVAADIAVYADGPARPTGGCGSVAMLVGRDAPLRFDLKTRATHSTNVWDFFKPNMDSEYPEVNGALSQTCYLRALDDCYNRFIEKTKRIREKDISLDKIDYFLFHSPYNKLVQKSFARLLYQDMRRGAADATPVEQWKDTPPENTYEDKGLEAALKAPSAPLYKQKVADGCKISKQIGNTYTASVYMNLAGLVSTFGGNLDQRNVALFSYGSGALASMLSIAPTASAGDGRFSLDKMQTVLRIAERMGTRELLTPDDLTVALSAREASHGFVPFKPTFSVEKLFPGTFYLDSIASNYERVYLRKPLSSPLVKGGPQVAPKLTTTQSEERMSDIGVDIDEDSPSPLPSTNSMKASVSSSNSLLRAMGPGAVGGGMHRNETYVWPSGRPNVKVVVTGVSAALPGRFNEVFTPGVDNVKRIISGESFLTSIPDVVKDQMLEKGVSDTKKHKDGSVTTVPISTYEDTINVSATIGSFSLTSYGVAESLVNTMERAVQVAIAAGLEALRDAGIVSGGGEGTSGWELPESMQNSTGVVYATSFPALDAAIAEVSKFYETKMVGSMVNTKVIPELRKRLEKISSENGKVSKDVEDALNKLDDVLKTEIEGNGVKRQGEYSFDRKFLFRVLVLGNAQLAQIIKAKGPNMQTNAACAGATQAIALAYDMIQVGRAERVVVIAGDSASSDNLMPWLGNGFRSLGAASTCADPLVAARPFHQARNGMILGSGGIGMVLESQAGAKRRFDAAKVKGLTTRLASYRCRLLGTLVSNSAYHGAAMDKIHIAQEMERFISGVEKEHGITRSQIARQGVYFSHETGTHASPASSCAANEIYGLRETFKDELKNLLILNTKGFTGHPMGVSFEDVVAAEVLVSGKVPPIANYAGVDPNLGSDLKLSQGGDYPCKYAMRFAAGFGSQIALALYGVADA